MPQHKTGARPKTWSRPVAADRDTRALRSMLGYYFSIATKPAAIVAVEAKQAEAPKGN
jgi:hypothetical protein